MKGFKFAYSYIKRAGTKIFGRFFLTAIVVTFIILALVYVAFRDTQLYRLDAISVWEQGVGESSDIAFSIYRANDDIWSARTPEFPEQKMVDTLTMPGEDSDPDIASNKTNAIAVWINEYNGKTTPAVTFWSANDFIAGGSGWSSPVRPFKIGGINSQPTVQMRSSKDAILVWVNNGWKLFYSEFNGAKWSSPKEINVPYLRRSITGLQLSENFDKSAPYTLSFFMNNTPMLAIFDGENWTIEKGDSTTITVPNIKMDSTINAQADIFHRVYTIKQGSTIRHEIISVNSKKDKFEDITNAILSRLSLKGASLYLLTKNKEGVLKDALRKQEISKSVQFFDVTAFYSDVPKSAISVWSATGGGVGYSIYSYNDGVWGPESSLGSGYITGTRRIKITPILVEVSKKEKIVKEELKPVVLIQECGDGKLDLVLGEQCEVGVACSNKNEICDWEIWKGASKKARQKMFPPDCNCVVIDEGEISGGDDTGKGTDADPLRPKEKEKNTDWGRILKGDKSPSADKDSAKSAAVWGGASCGFTGFKILTNDGDEMRVKLSPASKSGAEYTFSNTGGSSWSLVSDTGTMAIFPNATDQPQAAVLLTLSDNTVTFKGINPQDGFQYCVGSFTKGIKPEAKGLRPASAK